MTAAAQAVPVRFGTPAAGTDTPWPAARDVNWQGGSAAPVATAAEGLDLDIVSSRAGFDALEADWTDLYARSAGSAHLFQSFNWLWHWANHFLPERPASGGTRLAIVTARRKGCLVLVCPLVVSRTRGVRKLAWMGDPVSQYGDVLADADAVTARDIAAALSYAMASTKADVLRLRRVRSDAAVSPALALLGSETTDRQMAPYLSFAAGTTYDAYEKRYAKSAVKNRRRLMRRLEDRGPVAIERHAPGPDAGGLAHVAVSMKRAWLREKGLVSPALADPRTEAFFAAALGSDCRPAGVEAAVLKSNGETAAIEISVTANGRTAIHVIAYSLKFEKCGAGALLMEDSLRNACQRGITTVDLMAPGDAYKLDWADQSMAVEDWCCARSALGRVYVGVAVKLVRQNLKSALRAVPMPLRRFMSAVTCVLPFIGVA